MHPTQQCVLLVGGLGTRLGALTSETPKPLLPVDGRPFLEYLLMKRLASGSKKSCFLLDTAPTESRVIWLKAEFPADSTFKFSSSWKSAVPELAVRCGGPEII